ncbi:tolloid-like protein 2 isoform X2 [Octopus sinensis]|uniref:Tolloid-like protein 2 isoform X2 n=1 Tax=Octopus sinensis TaxID=2607531 RepID=A0A7E6F1B2_9MOLL|nr:tolloid-like protein 2 isoform X2 [Octopus sinensis]
MMFLYVAGQNENSSLIGIYCGQDFPEVKSSGRKIYVSFYADDKGDNVGFKAQYLSAKVGSECSGLTVLKAIRNKKNYLISPDYPHFYSSNLSCSWLITSTTVNRPIYLDVVDSDIEYSQSCMKDYVEIYLGPSRSSPIFSRWCGGTRRKFYTHSPNLFIHFHTDGYFTGRGFQLSYYLIQADTVCEKPIYITVLENIWHTLTSPYYPMVYEGNVTCTWIIEAQNPVHFVELQVDDSEIEESVECVYDSLSIYDGNESNSSLIKHWCGTEKPNILSSQSVIRIEFHTDVSYEYRGFKFRLRSVDPRSICGPISLVAVKSEVKYLTSPTITTPHYRAMSCYWLIGTLSKDHIIKVSIIVSSFNSAEGCENSYLKAYDGSSDQSHLIGHTCGNSTPTYISTGNQMLLTLKSTNVINGFFLSFTALTKSYECTNVLLESKREKSYFASPDFSASLKSTNSCSWIVYTQVPGDKVRLELVFTDIMSDDNCKDTYVDVYDGPNDHGLLLKKFCGRETPSLKSTGSHLFVRLTGHIKHATRFTAVHYSEPKENNCPALKLFHAKRTTQFFNVTPFSFPDDGRTCKWFISNGGGNDTILLQFLFTDMGEENEDCQSKYIAVYEGSPNSRTLLKKFCNDENPIFQTETKSFHVMFYSAHPIVDVSFVAKYELLSPTLELYNDSYMVADDEKQYFTSPDFFNQTDIPMNIQWIVMAKEMNDVIVLELAYSGMPQSYNCREAALRVYDNVSDIETDNMIGQFCGPKTVSIVSSTNRMLIWYSANWSAHSRGFMAVYYSKQKGTKIPQQSLDRTPIICIILIVAVIICIIYVFNWYWQCCRHNKINRLHTWRTSRKNYHKFDNDNIEE